VMTMFNGHVQWPTERDACGLLGWNFRQDRPERYSVLGISCKGAPFPASSSVDGPGCLVAAGG
jgi:hypothetical protein